MTLEQLVERSFRLTGQWDITALPTNADVSAGIELLNDIIAATPNCDIAFKDKFTFTLTPGKSAYTFALVAAPGVDYVSKRIRRIVDAYLTIPPQNNFTYPMVVLDDGGYEFYSSPRVLNSTGLPRNIYLENGLGVSTVNFYLPPDQSYPCTMIYIKDLSDFQRQTEISNVPAYQLRYFRYALARELCEEYNLIWSANLEKEYLKLLADIEAQNFKDMTVRTSDVRQHDSTYRRIIGGY